MACKDFETDYLKCYQFRDLTILCILQTISDFTYTTPTNNQVQAYDSATQKFKFVDFPTPRVWTDGNTVDFTTTSTAGTAEVIRDPNSPIPISATTNGLRINRTGSHNYGLVGTAKPLATPTSPASGAPASPLIGDSVSVEYNDYYVEYTYDGAAWVLEREVAKSSGGGGFNAADVFTGLTSGNTVTLTNIPLSSAMEDMAVEYNGVGQILTTDYTVVLATGVITFVVPFGATGNMVGGDQIVVRYKK